MGFKIRHPVLSDEVWQALKVQAKMRKLTISECLEEMLRGLLSVE